MKKVLILILIPLISLGQGRLTIRLYKKFVLNNIPKAPTRFGYFGDSFTSSPTAYPSKVNTANGIPFTNYAVGSTRVCSVSYGTTPGGNDLIDLYSTELNLGYTGQIVSFCYGTNDAGAGIVNSTWKSVYKGIIQNFISAGFPLNKLMIMTPPSHTNSSFLGQQVAMRQYVGEIASELGIIYFDVYQRFKDYGGDIFFSSADGYQHPIDSGQIIWATGFQNFFIK